MYIWYQKYDNNSLLALVYLYNLVKNDRISEGSILLMLTTHGQVKSNFIYIGRLRKIFSESITLAHDLFILIL